MMLTAGIFHGTVLSSRGSGVYAQRPVGESGEAMNDAKCKRGLTVPSASITLVTTSAFATKGGQVQASKCYRISSCSLLPCSPVLMSGPSADITILGAKRGQAGRNQPSLHVN